ncbi:DUF6602 domain-containing protein [Lewinella cohaerens]|uniref:DUF6602 domain-containing protein n=1 Tax=Lewinella cohaerens TaxID=70995 RepID=UPI000377E93B|nr:DUF6602 domain-containing protein [Lewinella cohaerens]
MKFDLRQEPLVIDVSKNYEEVKKLAIHKRHDTGDVFVVPEFSSGDVTKWINVDDYQGELIPFYLGLFRKYTPTKYVKISVRYSEYASYILRYLYGLTSEDSEEKVLLRNLEENLDLESKDAAILLKVLTAAGDIEVQKKSARYYFSPSKKAQKKFDHRKFLSTIIEELEAKSRRIDLLINHGGTVGSYRENLLINTLEKYLPAKFSISSGFIEGIPRQLDIVIYDSLNFIPLFNENNIVVVRKESVRAVIEVKSNLHSKELNDALELLYDITSFVQPVIPFFKGIFAFDTNYKSADGIAKKIINFHNQGEQEGFTRYRIEYPFQLLDSICIPNRYFLHSSHVNVLPDRTKELRPGIRSLKSKFNLNPEGAFFLSRLFAFLDVDLPSRSINNDYFLHLENEIDTEFMGHIYEDKWLSDQQIVGSTILSTEEAYKERYNNVVKWLDGVLTTSELFGKYQRKDR